MKPINFKPSPFDAALIDKLLSTGKYKTNADLLRNAIMQLALVSLSEKEYLETIADAYQNDVQK